MESDPLQADVYLIGLGIPEASSITLEAITALKKCRIIFTSGAGCYKPGFLNRFCRDVRVIKFDDNNKDQEQSIRKKLEELFTALERTKPIAFVSTGHPMFYSAYSHGIMDDCKAKSIPYAVISGISTFDAVFSTLRLDLHNNAGICAGDIGFFEKGALDPHAYLLVFRPKRDPQMFKRFIRRCLKVYPPDHRIALVECSNSDDTPERVRWSTLESCLGRLPELVQRTSLLIPPQKGRPQRGGRPMRSRSMERILR